MLNNNNYRIKREKYMVKQEARKFLKIIRGLAEIDKMKGTQRYIRYWMIIDLVMSTGLRVSELAGLKVKDFVYISGEPYLRVKTAKRKKETIDTIPLSKGLAKHIKEYLKWKNQYFDEDISEDRPLLTSMRGEGYSMNMLQKIFYQATKDAGMDKKSIHSARHTVGFLLYSQTKDLRAVQKQLRHKSPQSSSVYANVTNEELRSQIERLYE